MLLKFTFSQFDYDYFVSHDEIIEVYPTVQRELPDGSVIAGSGSKIKLRSGRGTEVKESPETVVNMVNNAFNKGIII